METLLFSENLWYAESPDSVRVQLNELIIDYDLAEQVIDLFEKATSTAKNGDEDYIGGDDGEFFYFYWKSKFNETNCGVCWSPSSESPLFELVDICKNLFISTTEKNISSEYLIERIKNLKSIIE